MLDPQAGQRTELDAIVQRLANDMPLGVEALEQLILEQPLSRPEDAKENVELQALYELDHMGIVCALPIAVRQSAISP